MERILDKYERYSYAERQLAAPNSELQLYVKNSLKPIANSVQTNWSLEYPKLVARIEVLQRNIRHYLGEDLDPLCLRELQHLEQQIDTALKRIRSRKNQLMHESISELQKKVKENEKTVAETEAERPRWEQQRRGQDSPTLMLPQPLRPPPLPPLTIGMPFQARGGAEDGGHGRATPGTVLMPPWMFRHVN
ncbi:hypothetical protein U1Q18_012216 [Sarracenia purpurea var. burkii]